MLVPPDAVSRTVGGDELLTIRTANARDATPADLLRAGYVPREVPSAEAWKAAHAEAERELIRARAALAEQPDPGTLAHLRADLRDAVKRAEKAEATLAMHGRPTYVEAVERAEKAERERDDLLARINQAEHEARCRGAEAKELVRVLEVERDEAKRLHSEAEAQVACRSELRAQVASLRAELARLTAPAEGSCWACREELGVAHERARQQPEKGRATDEELVDLYRKIYETHGGLTIDVSHGDCRRAAVLAVAAHVRKERCLVAQAVGMGAGVTISRMSERVPGTTGMWDVYVTRRPDVPGEHYAYGVPVADVPATLARLLGEVSRG